MRDSGILLQDIKARGVRVTPQRAIILDVIETLSGHVTAEEIHQAVQHVNHYISLATVYRTLELLRDLGLLTESRMGTSTVQYALREHANHHHAICRICRRSYEFPGALFTPIVAQLQREFQFTADVDHLVLMGLCVDCAAAP